MPQKFPQNSNTRTRRPAVYSQNVDDREVLRTVLPGGATVARRRASATAADVTTVAHGLRPARLPARSTTGSQPPVKKQRATSSYAPAVQGDEEEEYWDEEENEDAYTTPRPSAAIPYDRTRGKYDDRTMTRQVTTVNYGQGVAQNYTPGVWQKTGRGTKVTIVLLGITCLMVMGAILIGLLGQWLQRTTDGWRYGNPRTFNVDINVGHGGISHFTAQNLNGKVVVTEYPGGNSDNAKTYTVADLFGADVDEIPVTLAFRDMNRDNKPEMIIQVGTQVHILVNTGSVYRELLPSDQIQRQPVPQQ